MGYLVDFDFGTPFAHSETVAAFEAHSFPIRAWTGLGKMRQPISKNPFRPTASHLCAFNTTCGRLVELRVRSGEMF